MERHTELPWAIGSTSDDIGIVARNAGHGGKLVAMVVYDEDEAQDEDERFANAQLIVRAVNSHAELLAACKRALRALGVEGHEPSPEHARETLRAAIAKAEGRGAE